jgi:intracellular multiplication protein IcmK
MMYTVQRLAAVAFIACLLPAVAAAQTPPDAAFNDQMGAARQRADESLPFLVDSPDVLRTLQNKIWRNRQAVDDGVNPPPGVPTIRMVRVSPGMPETTNEINTIYGIPTSVTFIDITGAPWPLQWESKTNEYVRLAAAPASTANSNNPDQRGQNNKDQADPLYRQEAQRIANVTSAHGFAFEVPNPGQGGNTLNITTVSPGPVGGTNVFLQGARAPIPLILRAVGARGGEYDAVVTVQVTAHGPQAKPELIERDTVPETGGQAMFQMLQGHPPPDAIPLDVMNLSPDRIRAWKVGKFDYVLTDVTILGPQPQESEAGNGVSIYKIPVTPWVTIYDRDTGHATSIQLKERS